MQLKEIIARSKGLRTLKDLFTNPFKVLESTDDSYTSGFGYMSSVTGIIFFVILFLDKVLFQESLKGNNWRVPERLQLHHGISENAYEDFYGFVLTTGFLPGIFLALVILFWSKKSANYLVNLSFYVVAQILLIMSPFIAVNYLFEWDIDAIVPVIILVYFIYFFIKLGLNGWVISTLKAMIILSAGLFGLSLVEKPLEQFFVNLMERPNEVHHLEITDRSTFKNQVSLSADNMYMDEVVVSSDLIFYHDGYQTLRAVSHDGKLKWEKHHGTTINKMILIEDHKLLCVIMDTAIQNQKMDLIRGLDFDGNAIFSVTMDNDLAGRAYNLRNSTEDSFELFLPTLTGIHKSYIYQTGVFNLNKDGTWNVSLLPLFESTRAIYAITPLSGTEVIATSAITDGWQYASFEIARFDSLMNPQWSHTIYDKTNPYDPRVPAFHIVNTDQDEVIVHYSLANDTTVISYLKALNLADGSVKWQKEFFIPADFTEYFNMDYDDDHLYIVGESHLEIQKFFWQPYYHVGMICKIDRRTGELVSYRHFGNTQFGGHTRISDLKLTDTTIQLFGTLKGGDNLLGENPQAFMWEIAKKDI